MRADYDKVLKQRNALLKSAAPVLREGSRPPRPADEPVEDARASALHTLDVWNDHLATVGAQLLYARLRLLRDLGPYLGQGVRRGQRRPVRRAGSPTGRSLRERRRPTRSPPARCRRSQELRAELLATPRAGARRPRSSAGVSLVGPHRDDLVLTLGELPAKGYASHGESWSFALGLRLAAYQLLRHDLGDDPVLILDDVFAELDSGRRERLAALVADCEQVLITAAVPEDVPECADRDARSGSTSGVEVTRVA